MIADIDLPDLHEFAGRRSHCPQMAASPRDSEPKHKWASTLRGPEFSTEVIDRFVGFRISGGPTAMSGWRCREPDGSPARRVGRRVRRRRYQRRPIGLSHHGSQGIASLLGARQRFAHEHPDSVAPNYRVADRPDCRPAIRQRMHRRVVRSYRPASVRVPEVHRSVRSRHPHHGERNRRGDHNGRCSFSGLVHVVGPDLFRVVYSSILAWLPRRLRPQKKKKKKKKKKKNALSDPDIVKVPS